MNGDGADLRLGTHAHIGPEQPDAGGDDIVHLPFFEISAGVLPHQPDGEIAREHLPVVRVAAEVEVVAYSGKRRVIGFNGLVMGYTGEEDAPTYFPARIKAVAKARKRGFKSIPESDAAAAAKQSNNTKK